MKKNLKKLTSGIKVVVFIICLFPVNDALSQLPSSNQNYVIKSKVRVEGKTAENQLSGLPVGQINRTIQYFDHLGRPSQTVEWQASPTLRDLITPISYTVFGRQESESLPYSGALATSNGSYRTNAMNELISFYTAPADAVAPGVIAIPDRTVYSRTIFEASPLNRVLEQGAPGITWKPAVARTATEGRTVVMNYGSNIENEVRFWEVTVVAGAATTGYYPAGKLYKTITKDENWLTGKTGTIEEFKDFEGRLVLKRVWETELLSLSTYYVYDYLGNLRYVIPPAVKATSFTEIAGDIPFNQFIYAYHYDDKSRLVEKKLPGKGWEYLLYNKLDQVVGTQDILQRAKSPQEWIVNKYDVFGQIVLTGVYAHPSSTANISYRDALQTILNGSAQTSLWEVRANAGDGYSSGSWPQTGITRTLTVNYYDDYSIFGLPAAPYNLSANYNRMTKALPTASKVNVLGTSHMLWNVYYYNDKNQLVRSIQQHYKAGAVAVNNYDDISNTYLFSGELSSSTRRHYVNGVEQLYLSNRFTYDHQGRAKDTYQKIGDNGATTNAEILLCRMNYNEVGQLMNKQLHSTNLVTPVFAQTISYLYNSRGWMKSQSSTLFSQSLKYEEVITGVTSQYNGNISRQEWGTGKYFNYSYDQLNRLKSGLSSDSNQEKSIVYDAMGNIQGMQRYSANTLTDQLKYNYNGNQLSSVVDTNASSLALHQLPGTTTYTYDTNGNMTARTNTANIGNNIAAITYNYLNLPVTMTAGGNVITYTYDATGAKLRKLIGSSIVNEYIGGIQYESGVLKSIQTPVGRVIKNGTVYSYEYVLTDHLGNGRLYFDINAGVARKIQETDYYPFGLSIQRSLVGTENKYQYNGKEKQDQEKMYDYGARLYDPVIGRWNVMDPLAEELVGINPYNYVYNNPLNFIDPTGMIGQGWILGQNGEMTYDPRVNGQGDMETYGLSGKYLGESGYGIDPGGTGMGIQYNSDGTISPITQLLNEVSISAVRPGVGQPGLGESIIPVWGSGRAAIDNFQNGSYWMGSFNTAMAISDVFLLKTVFSAGVKLGAGLIGKGAVTEGLEAATKTRTSIGLGLDADLALHRGTGAITYKGAGWQQAGLTKVDWGRASMDNFYFKQSFTEAAQNAGAIKFNVSSFNPSYARPGITSFEFNHIISNPSLLRKTTFIKDGSSVFWNGTGFIR